MFNRRILITGASGFLGQALIQHLVETFPKSHIFSMGRKYLDQTGIHHSVCDLGQATEVKKIVATLKPELVFHLSGLSRVSKEIAFEDYFDANYIQTKNLLEAISDLNQEVKVLLASSVHVYGNQDGVITEDSLLKPQSSYAFTKYLAEESLKTHTKRNTRLRGIIVRLNSCLGPGQPLGFVASDLCHKLRNAQASRSDQITVGPLNSHRYFTDSRDVVRAFVGLMTTDSTTAIETFNIGSLKQTLIREVVEHLLTISQLKLTIESKDSEQNNFLGLNLDTSKFQKALPGFKFRNLDESLADMWKAH